MEEVFGLPLFLWMAGGDEATRGLFRLLASHFSVTATWSGGAGGASIETLLCRGNGQGPHVGHSLFAFAVDLCGKSAVMHRCH